MNNNEPFSKNFLLGLLAGGILGLLFAPKSGRQMRQDISEAYDEVVDKAGRVLGETGERVKEGTKEMAKKVTD